jgi:hypothetical protein
MSEQIIISINDYGVSLIVAFTLGYLISDLIRKSDGR